MPRRPLTEQEKDQRAAQRYNQRQQDKNPLWVVSGAYDELLKTGIVRERTPEDVATANAKYRAQLAAADRRAQTAAEIYADYLAQKDPQLHAETLAKVERHVSRYHLHAALVADIWHTAIRKRYGQEEAHRLHQVSKAA